jgi:hypothetical protein
MIPQNNTLTPRQVQDIVDSVNNGEDLSDDLYSIMFDHFCSDMPYGTAKARTGDPYQWICERLEEMGEDEIRAMFQV